MTDHRSRLNDATSEIVEAHPNVFDAETPKLGIGLGGLCTGRQFVELVQPPGGRIRIFLEEFESVFETADLPRSVSTDGLLFSSFEPVSKAPHQVDRLRSHGASLHLDVQGAACG